MQPYVQLYDFYTNIKEYLCKPETINYSIPFTLDCKHDPMDHMKIREENSSHISTREP